MSRIFVSAKQRIVSVVLFTLQLLGLRRVEQLDRKEEKPELQPAEEDVVIEVSMASAESTEAAEAAAPTPPRKATKASLDEETTCRWHFKHDILERLDEYFACMRTLRRNDHDAYELFSRVGIAIPAHKFFNGQNKDNIRKAVAGPRISFGGVILCGSGDLERAGPGKRIYPSFLYFRKMSRPSMVEAFKGDIYCLTALFDDRHKSEGWKSRLAHPASCHIGIGEDGSIKLLRELSVQVVSFRPPKKAKGAKRKPLVEFRQASWRYPQWIVDGMQDRIDGLGEKYKSPEDFASELFVMAFQTYKDSVDKIVVRAERAGLVAAFGIELPRAKYFFADREVEAASDGKRKRIFHSVAEHVRVNADGKESVVRFHFRGARKFEWQASSICIVLPRLADTMQFPHPSSYQMDMTEEEKRASINAKEVGKALGELMAS